MCTRDMCATMAHLSSYARRKIALNAAFYSVRTRNWGAYSRLLVEHEDVGPPLEEGVGSRETCETTTDDDDLSHSLCKCGEEKYE